ncbi:hypothetical protein BGZ47_002408 [Haplosporangium gracile]|nr:hypothetical protein BGZ47_002408 [Haplosporangium gracile]
MTPMLTVDERIDSFTRGTRSWPHPDTFRATPSSLAEAGFYWKPFSTSPDNVVCFLCGKSLDDWTKDDDPFEEHLSHSRNCCWAIVKAICPIEDGLPFRWDDEDNLPKGERMTKARLQTFGKWWPHERTKGWFGTTKRMANAGFIYAPTDDSDDNVQCPYCETALDGWEIDDDPVHEHQRRRPNCPFFATRAAAPTKASAAKAAKQKRKIADADDEDDQPENYQRTHGSGADKSGTKKPAKSNRSQKSTASESASSRSSNATGALSAGRNVDFDLQDNSEPTFKAGSKRQPENSAKAAFRTGTARIKAEEEEESISSILSKKSTKSTSRAKSASRSTSSTKSTEISKSKMSSASSTSALTISSYQSTRTSQSQRKRNQSADEDLVDSSVAEGARFSHLTTSLKKHDIPAVLKKRRKLVAGEEEADEDMWGEMMSDMESEAHDDPVDNRGDFDDVQEQRTGDTRQRRDSPGVDASEVSEKISSSRSVSPIPTKIKRGRSKKIKLEDEEYNLSRSLTKPKKKATSTKATKRAAKSTSLSSSKKRAAKPLIEIFVQPDVDDDVAIEQEPEQEKVQESEQEVEIASADMPEAEEKDKHGAEADQQVNLAEAPTLPIPAESTTLPETENILDARQDVLQSVVEGVPHNYPRDDSQDVLEGTAHGDPQDVLHDDPQNDLQDDPQDVFEDALEDVPEDTPLDVLGDAPHDGLQDAPPSTPPPIAPSTPTTPIRVQKSDSAFHQSRNTTDISSTPVRRQAVTFEDIEGANVVVVDPLTPVRRVASRMDIEGWEDEDRRDSAASELTSPFISPSQWHLDAGLMTSTPNGKHTPAQPFRGITPRQKRIKDVIGIAHVKSPLRSSHGDRLGRSTQFASPSPKKAARSQQVPPELKQSMLIDRLEILMHENASSEVMVVAEHALREEVKELRRSKNKERRQAAAEAEAIAAEVKAEAQAAAAAAATAASILKHKEITGRLEADAFFKDQGLEGSDTEDDPNMSFIRTPVKKTARALFESTTPTTPNKTPSALPVSRVLSAIGAASRRNNTTAALSPFVRTPVKKSTTDLLRLEDLEVDPNFPASSPIQAPPSSEHPAQPQPQPSAIAKTAALKSSVSQAKSLYSASAVAVQSSGVSMAKGATGSDLDATTAFSSSRRDLSHHHHHQQQQRGGGDTRGRRLHPDPEEHRQRTRLLEEANFSEAQLKMTVEEFHRACMAEQVLALEVAAEAWIQRFEEESNRVRRALLGDRMSEL